jgi:hypothetical protein
MAAEFIDRFEGCRGMKLPTAVCSGRILCDRPGGSGTSFSELGRNSEVLMMLDGLVQ